MRHRITIPSQGSLHTLQRLLSSNEFFPNDPSEFILSFNPKFTHFEPFVLAMLAAWADYWRQHGVPIKCENLDARGIDYAARMGLFEFLPQNAPRPFVAHESAGHFVPLCRLTNSNAVAEFLVELVPILHKHHPRYADAVKYCLSELTRNVVEHAGGAPAFACAQFYRNSDKVAIGVADCGIGIRQSLERVVEAGSDREAIVEALKPGVSGAAPLMYGSADNAGAGLFYNKCIAHASREYFAVISGDAAYRIRRKQDKSEFNVNPLDDRHDIYSGVPRWSGTVVAINISIPSGHEFSELIRRILGAYTKSFKPKKRPKINFT